MALNTSRVMVMAREITQMRMTLLHLHVTLHSMTDLWRDNRKLLDPICVLLEEILLSHKYLKYVLDHLTYIKNRFLRLELHF